MDKAKKKKPEPKCKCPKGTPFRTIEERDNQPADERRYYPWDSDGPQPTRSGHMLGCPADIATYKRGEWYCNCSRQWANDILIPRSDGELEIGDFKPADNEEREPNGYVGLYRKKSKKK